MGGGLGYGGSGNSVDYNRLGHGGGGGHFGGNGGNGNEAMSLGHAGGGGSAYYTGTLISAINGCNTDLDGNLNIEYHIPGNISTNLSIANSNHYLLILFCS